MPQCHHRLSINAGARAHARVRCRLIQMEPPLVDSTEDATQQPSYRGQDGAAVLLFGGIDQPGGGKGADLVLEEGKGADNDKAPLVAAAVSTYSACAGYRHGSPSSVP